MTARLFLIDVSGYIFRAVHTVAPLTNPQRQPVGAVYGFCRMILAQLRRLDLGNGQLTLAAAVFDPPNGRRENFRAKLDPQYKANRAPIPRDVALQFDLVRELAGAMGLPVLSVPGFEADDLIASYADAGRDAGVDVTILSNDKDLMQLVRPLDPDQRLGAIGMLDPTKQPQSAAIGPVEVQAKFGVPPHLVADVQALIGDSVDNVPGVEGIGQKTAAQIILAAGSLEAALAAPSIAAPTKRIAELLKRHRAEAQRSFELVTLRRDVPLPLPLPELIYERIDYDRLRPVLKRHDFRSILEEIGR